MNAVKTKLEADRIDTTDYDAVEQWARTLRILNLNKKNISSVKPVVFFTALQELYLFDNLISDARPIGKLRQLRKLNLNENKISSVPRFNSLQMQYLYLKDNKFSSISNLSNLAQLKTLLLKENKISNPSAVARFPSLGYLDLRDNNISSISSAMSVMGRNPYLKGNPVCRLRIHTPQLQNACRRTPPLIAHPVIIDRPVITAPIRINPNIIFRPGVATPVNP